MMRIALAELDEYGHAMAWSVAIRAAHDTECDCTDEKCVDTFEATRSQLVSARRALHTLARTGHATLVREPGGGKAPPILVAKRPAPEDMPPEDSGHELLPETRQLGIRESDRCDSCARPWTEVGIASTCYGDGDKDPGVYRVRGLALCRDCDDGVIDPISLASDGAYAINRMEPIPCGKCGGELSEAGLRRIYINGARLPLCDPCFNAKVDKQLRDAGLLGLDHYIN
jgi:hypothetical protein